MRSLFHFAFNVTDLDEARVRAFTARHHIPDAFTDYAAMLRSTQQVSVYRQAPAPPLGV